MKIAIYGCLYENERIGLAYTQIKDCVAKARKEKMEIMGLYFDVLYSDTLKREKAISDIRHFVKTDYPDIDFKITQ